MQLFQFLFVLLCLLMLVQGATGQEQNVSATGQQQNISATGDDDGDVVPQFGWRNIFNSIGKGFMGLLGWGAGQVGTQLGLQALGGH